MRPPTHLGGANDFLALLARAAPPGGGPPDAVALCDRRTGIGADGLIRVGAGTGEADVTMLLLNADGSEAEMSGNGIRCLAQAVFQAQLATPPVLRVATAAGLRTVTAGEITDERSQQFTVEMGPAKVGADEPEWVTGSVLRATRVDVGNPHVVLQWAEPQLPGPDVLVELGSRINDLTPGGTNVEIVIPGPGHGDLQMVVFERGVGPTMACGTGACAVAAAGRLWELSGARATVLMPGGPVDIALADSVLLTGDATSIATVYAPWP
jgi:diaminopimelate epimerase